LNRCIDRLAQALVMSVVCVVPVRGRSADPPPEPLCKNHMRVMYYVDEQGNEQRVKTTEDWERRRLDIVRGLEAGMGPLPDRSSLGPVRFETVPDSRVDEESLSYEKLMIDVGDNDRLPALLFVPKSIRGKAAGIVAIHQTNGPLGKKEVAGLGGNPNLHYGIELARRGYVVIAPDYPTLGEYQYDFNADRFISGSMKGIWNHMRCVDLLAQRSDVDPQRIGAIGHSLGGHNSIFLGVFDTRVKVVVSSCGWTPHHDYYAGNLAGWSGERYLPRFREVYGLDPNRVPFDYYELISALAPRGFFSCSPVGDSNFAVIGVKKTMPVAQEVFDLLSAGDRLQIRYPECGHDFPQEVRWEAYSFIDRLLAP